MAQHRRETHDTLEQLESIGDRLVQWIGDNPLIVLTTAGLILLAAASIGGYEAWHNSKENAASAALAALRSEYVAAMGGQATDLVAPEPANPETAKSVRSDFIKRFESFSSEHAGTMAADLARLEVSELHEQLGEDVPALQTLLDLADDLPQDSAMRGVVESRIAFLQEKQGDFEAAARAHEAAASAEGYPLRWEALGDAARCWAEAGKPEQAVADWERLKSQAPDVRLPAHVEARLSELAARAGGPASPSAGGEPAPDGNAGAQPSAAPAPDSGAGS